MKFDWFVFVFLCVLFARELGLPPYVCWAIWGALLLLMLLVLVGVLGRS